MTQQQHVYAIQNLLARGTVSDNKDFSNEFIAHLLKVNRALLIQRKMEKNKEIHSSNKKVICMPLAESQYADCPSCNLPELSCTFLKGVTKLPKAIISTSGFSYVVRTITGEIIPKMTVTNSKYNKYSQVKSAKSGWFILENDLYIIWEKTKDNLYPKLVLVEFVPEDPEEVSDFDICAELDVNTPCVQNDNLDFALDSDLINPLYKMTLEMLGYSYSYPQDDLNNSRSADNQKSNE